MIELEDAGSAQRLALRKKLKLLPKDKTLDLSKKSKVYIDLAVREGFEPSIRDYRIHAFQACSFSHSDTSPFLGNL